MLVTPDDVQKWNEIQQHIELFLDCDVNGDNIPKTILKALTKYKEELETASKYIAENEVIHRKTKKGIPTVIEYQGRRYVLDHANNHK